MKEFLVRRYHFNSNTIRVAISDQIISLLGFGDKAYWGILDNKVPFISPEPFPGAIPGAVYRQKGCTINMPSKIFSASNLSKKDDVLVSFQEENGDIFLYLKEETHD